MNLQDYIHDLVDLRDEHGGEIEVVDSSEEPVGTPEYNDDDPSNPVIVICDKA